MTAADGPEVDWEAVEMADIAEQRQWEDHRDALAAAEARGVERGRAEALKSAARMLLAEAESFGSRATLSDWERGYERGLERAAHDVANSIGRGSVYPDMGKRIEVPDVD